MASLPLNSLILVIRRLSIPSYERVISHFHGEWGGSRGDGQGGFFFFFFNIFFPIYFLKKLFFNLNLFLIGE